MAVAGPRYDNDEFARRGKAAYTAISSAVEREHPGEFVAIDIDSGEYEIDADELTAAITLASRKPGAQPWIVRIGHLVSRRVRYLRTGGAG